MADSNALRQAREEERRKAGLCYKCGKRPPEDNGSWCATCRERDKRAHAKLRKKNKDAGLCTQCRKRPPEGNKGRCAACLESIKRSHAKLHKQREDNGLCKCGRVPEPGRKTCERCLTRGRQQRQGLRDKVFKKYGGPKCACCGETQKAFLSIDHVNNDGAEHRRKIGRDIYNWLKKNDFPPGYQVLCRNCNWAKGQPGGCPHQTDSYGRVNAGMITPEQFVNQLTPDEARARLDAIDAEARALRVLLQAPNT